MKNNILLIFFFISLSITAQRIEVCRDCDVKTIKEAIELAEPGSEILIKKGVYKEHDITIDKSISLIGEEGAIIDGENSGGILIFDTKNFTIKGLKIINVGMSYTVDYAAIKVIKADNFTIEECILKMSFSDY